MLNCIERAAGGCSEYCQRIGAQWIGFPTWQLDGGHEKDKLVLSKAEKKCAGLIRDLMKRKGGGFFEFAVDPSSDESGGLADYFEKVFASATPVRCMRVFVRYLFALCLKRQGRQTVVRLAQVLTVLVYSTLLPITPKRRKCRALRALSTFCRRRDSEAQQRPYR